MLRRFLRRPAVQSALARLLGLYLLLVYRTTRWRVEGWEHVPPGFLAAFWHEMLPLMPLLVEGARARGLVGRAHVLVSRHRDGRFIAAGVRRFGVETVHASSSRGGAAGALALVRLVRAGGVIAITPDGPRGPRRAAAPGVAQLSALAGVPVLPVAGHARPAVTLGSWDRMRLPLPFGRGALVIGAPLPPGTPLPAIAAALDAAAARARELA
ncbi:lysophospholipid acyltransferase family protein [Roseococcus sp. DSY-14]|uniref:lysophospholipid acyltransferase family protein n=1 Tax=Roseococcus sp. DSY-14 TaxID=3369650 RepID=UPI00387B1E7B